MRSSVLALRDSIVEIDRLLENRAVAFAIVNYRVSVAPPTSQVHVQERQ